MKRYTRLFRPLFATFLFLGAVTRPVLAEELSLQIQAIGPDSASPFPTQLHLQVTNESFTSTELFEKLNNSELIVDGHAFKRSDAPLNGPPGLPPKGTWEGCLGWDAYAIPEAAPGSHHLQWRLGKALSQKVRAIWPKPVPAASSPKERRRQVEALKDAISLGLLRSCVENWLTEKDGGLAESDAIRYYVDPGVKVLVPYDKSVPEPRVNGPIKVYLEGRVAD